MPTRTIVSLFALIFGGSSAAGVYLLGSQSPKGPDANTQSLVAVNTDVPRGANLTADMLYLRPWPEDFVPAGAITRIEDAVDRSVSIPLVKDEPLVEGKLAAKGAGRGMAALIPRGMRAVTIQTPNVSTGVAGFILPGNRVDVLVTLSQSGLNDEMGGGGTTTLLQNVEILAVDQRIEAPSENLVDPKELRSVTLLVTPEEAARLDLGQNKGTLSLALRNPEDTATADVQPATLARLRFNRFGLADPAESVSTSLPEPSEESQDQRNAQVEPASHTEPPATASRIASGFPIRQAQPMPIPPPIRTLRGSTSGVVHLQPVR